MRTEVAANPADHPKTDSRTRRRILEDGTVIEGKGAERVTAIDLRRALVEASRSGDEETVDQMLRYLDNALQYALVVAAEGGHRRVAELLVASHKYSDEALEEGEGVAYQAAHNDVAEVIGQGRIEVD